MVFKKQYAWVETTLKKEMLNAKINHLFVAGKSQSGKTYLLGFFAELAVERGVSKLFILNCNKKFLLEEQLMFLFPNTNKNDMKKIMKTKTLNEKGEIVQAMPKGFKVKVYVPISAHCPDKLPENFVPFSIAVNDWEEENLQIFYGDRDVARIKSVYDTQIKYSRKKNIGYSSLKNILRKFKNSTILKQRGYLGAEVTYFTPKAQQKTIDGFFGRMQQFNEQGIVANEKFPHNLKDLLKEELKDQKTIVILDTEYLNNALLEYFVIGYFTKTIMELMDKDGMKHKLKHKVVLWFDEIRFLFPSFTEHKKSVHVGMSDIGAKLLTIGRHARLEMWMSVQSPSYIPASLLKNIDTKIVTMFEEKDDMDWIAEYIHNYTKDLVKDMFATFRRLRAKGDYRFAILEQRISKVTLQATPRTGWGNKLPRPRLSFYYSRLGENKVPLNNLRILEKDSWSGIDLGIKLCDKMGKAKRLLLAEIQDGEKRLETTIKREKEEEMKALAYEQRRISEEENRKIRKVAEITNLIGENYSQISAKAGISRDDARKYSGRAMELGLVYPLDRIEKRKRAIKLLNKGKDIKKLGLSEEEATELVAKAKKYYLISRRKEVPEAEEPKEVAVEATNPV